MSTLYITEFRQLGEDVQGRSVPVAKWPANRKQTLTYTTTAASAAFKSGTKFIRIVSATACHYNVGDAPLAAVTDALLPANTVEIIGVQPSDKIAAVDTA